MFFDSHAHFIDDRFGEDRDEVLNDLKNHDVCYVINVASDLKTSYEGIQLSNKYEWIFPSVGIHPHDVVNYNESNIEEIKVLCKNEKVVAIGEIGLDYYYEYSPKDMQKNWFRKQINLAREVRLPVIIHDRDAHKDCLDIINEEKIQEVGGVFHCYSGSWEMAKEILKKGMYISFSGSITFKNAKKLLDTVKNIPLDRILIETDCPYLTPEPYRGKRNDSRYIKYTAGKIAEIRNLSVEEVAQITTDNAKKLFDIDNIKV